MTVKFITKVVKLKELKETIKFFICKIINNHINLTLSLSCVSVRGKIIEQFCLENSSNLAH